MAQLTSIFYNFAQSFGSKDGKRQMSKPTDFLPWWENQEKRAEQQSVEDMKRVLMEIAGPQKKGRKKESVKPKYPKPFKGAPVVRRKEWTLDH